MIEERAFRRESNDFFVVGKILGKTRKGHQPGVNRFVFPMFTNLYAYCESAGGVSSLPRFPFCIHVVETFEHWTTRVSFSEF